MKFRAFRKDVRLPCVLFVSAKWCPHCRDIAPEVDRAQQLLGSAIPVYVVDSDRDADAVRSLGIEGFPTILAVGRDRRVREYSGTRNGRAIAEFAMAVDMQ